MLRKAGQEEEESGGLSQELSKDTGAAGAVFTDVYASSRFYGLRGDGGPTGREVDGLQMCCGPVFTRLSCVGEQSLLSEPNWSRKLSYFIHFGHSKSPRGLASPRLPPWSEAVTSAR